jgi:hypothetical protein
MTIYIEDTKEWSVKNFSILSLNSSVYMVPLVDKILTVCAAVCLFCLFIATRAIFQLSGGCHHCRWQGCKFRPLLGAQGLSAGRDLYHTTPTATRDFGLNGLIRKTGTHVPQWDSNPQRKDHYIFASNALTTAPRRRLAAVCNLQPKLVLWHNDLSGCTMKFSCEVLTHFMNNYACMYIYI